MRQWWIMLALTLAAATLLGACADRNAPPPEASLDEAGETPEASRPDSEPEWEEDSLGTQSNIPAPMGTALYRGTVEAVNDLESGLVLKLAQAPGTDYGHKELLVAVNDDTKSSVDLSTIREGDYLEIYYGAPPDGSLPEEIAAIVVNRLAEADMANFNGTLQELSPGEQKGEGSMRLVSLDGANEILFHYDRETQFYLDFDALEQGDGLNVFYSGITTRSLPPQATALEVRPLSGGPQE